MCDAGASGPRSPLIAGSARPLLNPEPNRLGARREPAQPLRADPDVKNEQTNGLVPRAFVADRGRCVTWAS